MSYTNYSGLSLYDEFAGWGGSTQGATAVPGVELILAANHNPLAVEVHEKNFPYADHYCGDIQKAEITKFPRADLFWASPACPAWTDARGKKRDFDQSNQGVMFDKELGPITPQDTLRSRALMEEIPRYLAAMARKGKPVLAGVVENVIQCRKWAEWGRWLHDIRVEGYETRVIALNAMHAQPIRTRKAPQSRDRLFVAYWLNAFGRTPDWNRWLRPTSYCPTCDEWVQAVQVFKKPRNDMGRYGIRHGQYIFRCPHLSCRNQTIEPPVLPAAAAIDWSLPPGQKIGERVDAKGRPDPLEPSTIARIEAGLARYGGALLSPAGGTWRDAATPLTAPMPTRTTRESDGLVLPPGCQRDPVTGALLSTLPFIAELRGGGSKNKARGVDEPLSTFSAQGFHHGLVQTPDAVGIRWNDLLVPYYRTGVAHPVTEPMGTLPTKERFALVGVIDPPRAEQCTFRMVGPKEIGAGMAFAPNYQVKGTITQQAAGYGNAVPPPMAEVVVSALVECITGESLD
jgi:DNA (cytosine-5)-methyltransferase 1